jgi:hypothetical protein
MVEVEAEASCARQAVNSGEIKGAVALMHFGGVAETVFKVAATRRSFGRDQRVFQVPVGSMACWRMRM